MKRTITLTDRRPVQIDDDAWPLIASARDSEHDGQVEYQANCRTKWFLGVRQHADGRTLVYAAYDYSTDYRNSRDYKARRGALLESGGNIVDAIKAVSREIAAAECFEGDAARWTTLAADCIAALPAETLD